MLIFSFLLALGLGAQAEGSYEKLFTPVDMAVPASQDPTILRSRRVQFRDFVPLGDSVENGAEGLVLNLFDDVELTAVLERMEWRGEGRYTWFGDTLGAQYFSDVILTREDGLWGGHIAVDHQMYTVEAQPNGYYLITERGNFPEFKDTVTLPSQYKSKKRGPTPPKSDVRPAGVPPDDGRYIDIMVVYTGAASSGTTSIINKIQQMIDQTNQAFVNSEITTRARLVRSFQVSYQEVGADLLSDSIALGDNDVMRDVNEQRELYGADIVALVINRNLAGALGIACLSNTGTIEGTSCGTSIVVQLWLSTERYVMAHEIGHNLGSNHDRANGGFGQAYSYGYGYYNSGSPSFGTIMAYPGTRIPYFSNPDVLYSGVPTGIIYTSPTSADNARSINNMAPTIAGWRDSKVSETQFIEKVSAGCFIATAAFGSDMAPKVKTLRKFRDRILARSSWGQMFIKYYYAVSPTLAQYLDDHPRLKPAVRVLLYPWSWFAGMALNYFQEQN